MWWRREPADGRDRDRERQGEPGSKGPEPANPDLPVPYERSLPVPVSRNLPVPVSRNLPVSRPGASVTPFVAPGLPSRRAFLEREIARLIKSQPREAARLIRDLLHEDEP